MEDSISKDPAVLCANLRELGKQHPSMERIEEVERHLESKLQSVQSIAAQILARWKSRESFSKLRSAFEKLPTTSDAQRSLIAKAIGDALRPEDTDYVVNWFLSLPTYNDRYELLPTLRNVDSKRAKLLLMQAWSTSDQKRKHSILVAASEMRVLRPFVNLAKRDSDSYIRKLAAMFTLS